MDKALPFILFQVRQLQDEEGTDDENEIANALTYSQKHSGKVKEHYDKQILGVRLLAYSFKYLFMIFSSDVNVCRKQIIISLIASTISNLYLQLSNMLDHNEL